MFGHTFFIMSRKNSDNLQYHSYLLNDTLSYAAFVPPNENIILYPFKGLFGWYKGKFSLLPYFSKIQEYNNYENRDIWEYELNLTEDEIKIFPLIMWELGNTNFDYYYFDDNCALMLLVILDAIRPSLNLGEKRYFYISPSDSIKFVYEAGLISNITLRPSAFSRYVYRTQILNNKEQQILKKIITKNDINILEQFKDECDNQCLVNILDAAVEYIDYKEKIVGAMEPIKFKKLRQDILIKRSSLNIKSTPININKISHSPHEGHKSFMAQLQYGKYLTDEKKQFFKLRLRPALHDIESSSVGYSNNMQMEFFDLHLIYIKNSLYLEKLIFLQILSLPERFILITPFAWKVALGIEKIYNTDTLSNFNRFYLQFEYGLSYHLWKNYFLIYAISGIDAGITNVAKYKYNIGPLVETGLIWDITPKIKLNTKFQFAKLWSYSNFSKQNFSSSLSYYFSTSTQLQFLFEKEHQKFSRLSLSLAQYY